MSRINVAEKYGRDLGLALDTETVAPWLHMPYESGKPWWAPAEGFRIATQGTTLEGDGVIGEDVGLRYADETDTGGSTILRIAAPHVTLCDLVLSNNRGPVSGAGDGISHLEPRTLWSLLLERVNVLYAGRHCLHLAPERGAEGDPEYHVSPRVVGCVFYGAGSDGVVVDTCNFATFDHVTSTRHAGRGFLFRNCGSSRFRVVAEHVSGGALLKNCSGCEIGGHFESFAGAREVPEPAIILDNCRGCTVRTSTFADFGRESPTSILLRNGTTGCVIEASSHWSGVAVDDGGCRGNVVFRQHGGSLWVSRRRNRVIE